MRLANTGLSNLHKFIIALSIIGAFALFDYQSVMGKIRRVELYNDINGRLISVRMSIDKLDYLIDMVVVSNSVEGTTIDIIKNDMNRLDKTIAELTRSPGHKALVKDDTIIVEGLSTIANDWQPIKSDISRFNAAMSLEAVMPLHSDIDMNAIILSEKAESILGIIDDNRKEVLADIKMIALKSVIGFFVMILAELAVFQVMALSPIQEAADSARQISSGNLMARFRDKRAGFLSKLSSELNRALDYVNGTIAARDMAHGSIASSLRTCVNQVEAIGSVLGFAGRTLSKNEVLQMALKEAVASGGANAAAVYMREGGVFRLKSSAGLGEDFIRELSDIRTDLPDGAVSQGPLAAFKDIGEVSDQRYAAFLRNRGFNALEAVPLTFNNRLTGYLYLFFMKGAPESVTDNTPFFTALASGISVLMGHFDLFNEEHGAKRFLDRVIHQIPAGFAVFEISGRCVVINSALKKLLGADQRFTIAGEYNIFEDEILNASGFMEQIKKTCEGYSTEFVLNFNPNVMKKYNFFKGPSKRLKIKTVPLYDEGGEISNIFLIYEEIPEQNNGGTGATS